MMEAIHQFIYCLGLNISHLTPKFDIMITIFRSGCAVKPIIDIQNVSFGYTKNQTVLKNINLTINKGEWVTILGHNGSGKSTLSKLLIGLLKARTGEIEVAGQLLTEETVYDIRKKVGIVFQNPDNQFVGVTVRDDIAFGLENLQVKRETMLKRIDEVSKRVDMFDFLNKEPQQLSGGQKQRVAIAGILAMETDIIIFDESTSMLDPKGRRKILEYMRRLHDEGTTIITITHDMSEAVHSDRIIVLKNGEIIKDDTSQNVLKDKSTLEASNLELLLPLEVLHYMDENKINHEEIKRYLWQSTLKE